MLHNGFNRLFSVSIGGSLLDAGGHRRLSLRRPLRGRPDFAASGGSADPGEEGLLLPGGGGGPGWFQRDPRGLSEEA